MRAHGLRGAGSRHRRGARRGSFRGAIERSGRRSTIESKSSLDDAGPRSSRCGSRRRRGGATRTIPRATERSGRRSTDEIERRAHWTGKVAEQEKEAARNGRFPAQVSDGKAWARGARYEDADDVICATTLWVLGIATASLGLMLVLVGKLRLASLAQYLPVPVVGGYLAYRDRVEILSVGLGFAIAFKTPAVQCCKRHRKRS